MSPTISRQQDMADQHLRSAQQGPNPNLSPEYDTGIEVLRSAHTPESGLGADQKEPDLNSGLGQSRAGICGMKKKTFMMVSGVLVLLIIAMVAGVGGGVAGTAAKNKGGDVMSSIPTSSSSAPIDPLDIPTPTSTSGGAAVVTLTTFISGSASPTPILKDTPLAAVNWGNNIQLFYKHTDGTIRSQENGGLAWGKQSSQITKPKGDSRLAVIGWLDGGVRQVRVYTASEENTLKESLWNSTAKQWRSQYLPGGLDLVAAGSHLTAYTWFQKTSLQIRVYYQGEDGYIREAAYNKGWGKGLAARKEDWPRAKTGTGLAIVSPPDTNKPEAKLYYQSMDGKLTSYDYKPAATFADSWHRNTTIDYGSIPDRAHLTAVLNKSGDTTLRIYFVQNGELKEIWWNRKGGWRKPFTLMRAAAPGVAAISYPDNVRVFFQYKTEYLSALGLNRVTDKWEFSWVM